MVMVMVIMFDYSIGDNAGIVMMIELVNQNINTKI